jgi:predicted DNA-binding WGR domain protein
MVRRIKLAPSGWISRLAAAVLMTVIALQGCDSSVDKVETQEVSAEDLVAIDIIVSGEKEEYIRAKRGFINTKGEMVISPRIDFNPGLDDCCDDFERYKYNFASNGLLAVEENGKYGYINAKGEMLIPARFHWVDGFAPNGLAAVQEKENGKYGYINAKGEMVIPARFQRTRAFGRNGLAMAKDDDGTYFINDHGEVVAKLALIWDWAEHYADNGLAPLPGGADCWCAGVKWGYVNTDGEMVISPRFKEAGDFAATGLAVVVENDKTGYINAKGEMLIPTRFDEVRDFAVNGLALVEENGRYGYIDEKGDVVIPLKFAFAGNFAANGLAAVTEDREKWGYINAKGEMLIKPRFDDAENFSSNGVAKVEENGKVSYINETGQVIAYIDEIGGRKVVKNARDEVIWSEEIGLASVGWIIRLAAAVLMTVIAFGL